MELLEACVRAAEWKGWAGAWVLGGRTGGLRCGGFVGEVTQVAREAARGSAKGWEGRDQRKRCEARERSGPLDSPTPARSKAEGRG
ncbi:hypothetical protein GCM10023186_22120 [Hymenobacter koreensis]|uniref:Uncharacterized protein n=1 Tax=Hymenobacter koreensis TaxID=1084523 RepID=A0ABP8IZH6_9BACT